MLPARRLPPRARALLELAARDRAAARRSAADLDPDSFAELVCLAPARARPALLDLAPDPAAVIARIPEVDLCTTLDAVGVPEAGWILEHATPEQITACVDLDAWQGEDLSPERFGRYLAAAAEAGDATLLRLVRAVDPEVAVLYLTDRVEVIPPADTEAAGPPEGAVTIDGRIYLRALRAGDDLADLLRLLRVLFTEDPPTYHRLLLAPSYELRSEMEEFARRWRDGRLEDLGFPPREEALELIAHLPPEHLADWSERPTALETDAWRLPVWLPSLPVEEDARHPIFRAAARLDRGERQAFFYAFVAVANALARAIGLPLGEADSLPGAVERAAELASRGLGHIAETRDADEVEVLRRVPLARLVRVGANLERAAGGRPAAGLATAGPGFPEPR